MNTSISVNPRPFLKALGLSLTLIFGLAIYSHFATGGDLGAARAVGEVAFHISVGGLALGIWARRAHSRWTWWGFIWRFMLCVIIASLFVTIITVAGRPRAA